MRGKRQVLRSAAALGALVAVALIAAGGVADAAAKRGGTLTLARPDEPLSLDPVIPSDNGSIYAVAQICESLVSADDSGKGLVPGRAESWEVAPDGLSVLYKLRDGVKFSNGQPLTVDDAVFSLQRVAKPDTTFGFAFEAVKSIEKADDSHLKITLKTP